MNPRLRLSILVTLAVAVGLFHGWLKEGTDLDAVDRIEDQMVRTEQWEGRYPPDFELPLLDDGTFTLADHIGERVVVLNFFATWCGPCRAEMPELQRYYDLEKEDDFLLVGIDVEEDREVVLPFIEELDVTFPVVLDRDGQVAASYDVSGFPTTVLIGVDGMVKLYEVGAISNADVAFGGPLEEQRELLAGNSVEGPITRQEYLAAVAGQEPLPGAEQEEESEEPPLEGRALEIARHMPCPCGCDDRVNDCGCSTAGDIRADLAEMNLEGRSDAEIMRQLNREHCVGDEG